VTALLLALATADQTYSLEWRPKLGESHTYSLSVDFNYQEGSIRFDSSLRTTVLGVAGDGSYRLEVRTTHAVATSGSDKQEIPDQQPQVQKYDRRGMPLGLKPTDRDKDPFADLLDHLTEFQSPGRPVAIGESWLNAVSGPKLSLFGIPRITYRLDSVSRSGTGAHAFVRYTASSGFDKYVATGSLILSRPNNSLMHMDVKIPHFAPEGSGEEAAVSVVLQETS
jgi:hypothetical protein